MNRFSGSFPLSVMVFLFCAMLGTAGCGSSNSRLRVLQGSPNQSTITVVVNGSTVSNGLAYAADTGYISLSSSSPHLQIELPGSSTAVIDQTPSLGGTDSTFVTVTSAGALTGFLVADDNSAPSSGNAKLRVLNASPDLPSADVYIVQPGASIGNISPTISGLTFQAGSSYQSLAAGSYEIFLAFPGTKMIAVDSGTVALTSGQIRTLGVIDTSFNGSRSVTLADMN